MTAAPAITPGTAPFTPTWRGGPTPEIYHGAVRRIHEHIAAGDTYQVNYTYRLRAPWDGDPFERFTALARAQRSRYAAFIDAGRYAVLSASPELCFRLEDDLLTCRPMKGTAPRGLTLVEDRLQAAGLRASEKERAENVMIVDMVRNDLGRIARVGTVRVPRLWETERYPTLWQMTSTVRAETAAPLDEILLALFPSASITGAPKVRTMQIIKETERTPRGIYTGCVGVLGPGRRGWMNVAIRTLVVDRRKNLAEYGTGSGIVWDARAAAEFDECRTKTLVLGGLPPPFRLIETLAWTPGEGLLLLERHLRRIGDSAAYFGFACDAGAIRARLVAATRGLRRPQRVRLLLDERGGIEVTVAPLGQRAVTLSDTPPSVRSARAVAVALAQEPVRRRDRFLYHKTTRRQVYEQALAGSPGCDDVILVNEEGEVTESTIANVVVRDQDGYWTPPVGGRPARRHVPRPAARARRDPREAHHGRGGARGERTLADQLGERLAPLPRNNLTISFRARAEKRPAPGQNPALAAVSTQRRICGSSPSASIPTVQIARTAPPQVEVRIGGTADCSGVGFSMYIQRITVR